MDFNLFIKITGLALADAVNPCELAILAMVLMTILIQNPDNRKKVLYGGLAFTSAVYIGYLFYGLIISQFFITFSEFLREKSVMIYKGLGVIAMILGGLNIKDFFYYKKGSFLTEMPIFLRPKAKKVINRINSTGGAFFIGFLVTVFLLPCTIGPLIVASGILSELSILTRILWFLYYTLIFISPMIVITLIVFFGFAKVDEVSGWKEKNIRKLHLVAGILLFLIGIALLMNWL
ncbi:MAG: hypothetical protein AABW81_00415 [Nanoarchaeota archaeon]